MIDARSRSREWILESCQRNNVNDPTLMEKTIRAFSLLEALARSGCPFLFKGGSALMLQLGCTQRLSVDIDIVCPPDTDVIAYLEPYATEYGFGEIVRTERLSRTNVPKTHAKCFYQVSYVTNTAQEKVLLDVLFEDMWYSQVEQLPIVRREVRAWCRWRTSPFHPSVFECRRDKSEQQIQRKAFLPGNSRKKSSFF